MDTQDKDVFTPMPAVTGRSESRPQGTNSSNELQKWRLSQQQQKEPKSTDDSAPSISEVEEQAESKEEDTPASRQQQHDDEERTLQPSASPDTPVTTVDAADDAAATATAAPQQETHRLPSPTIPSFAERNPDYTRHTLPVERLFAAIRKEFLDVEVDTLPAAQYSFKLSRRFYTRNRYANILPIDKTVFPPKTWADEWCGYLDTVKQQAKLASAPAPYPYINANLVSLEDVETNFIACQAPLPNCFDDFYDIIWRYRITLVVMLTENVESEIPKADRYWPPTEADLALESAFAQVNEPRYRMYLGDMGTTNKPFVSASSSMAAKLKDLRGRPKGDYLRFSFQDECVKDTLVFGDYMVSKDPDAAYVYDPELQLQIRPLVVQPTAYALSDTNSSSSPAAQSATNENANRRPPLKIVQVQYTGWPDHGVPTSTDSFNALIKLINEHTASLSATTGAATSSQPPIIVHCSAGIGRTGSLIGVYAALDWMKKGILRDGSLASILRQMRRCRYGMVQRAEQYMYMYEFVLKSFGFPRVGEYQEKVPKQAEIYNGQLLEEIRLAKTKKR